MSISCFHKVDAQLDAPIQNKLAGSRVKAQRIKNDLLFDLIAENIVLAQQGRLLRIQAVGVVGQIILYKDRTNRRHAVLSV